MNAKEFLEEFDILKRDLESARVEIAELQFANNELHNNIRVLQEIRNEALSFICGGTSWKHLRYVLKGHE